MFRPCCMLKSIAYDPNFAQSFSDISFTILVNVCGDAHQHHRLQHDLAFHHDLRERKAEFTAYPDRQPDLHQCGSGIGFQFHCRIHDG